MSFTRKKSNNKLASVMSCESHMKVDFLATNKLAQNTLPYKYLAFKVSLVCACKNKIIVAMCDVKNYTCKSFYCIFFDRA